METEESSAIVNVYPFKDTKPMIDPILNYDAERSGKVLIVENGSYNCRMGWDRSGEFDCSSLGSNGLVFKSVMVKTRKEKGKESELQVANDIPNIEAVRYSLKTPFDRNIVTQFEHEETMLDYGFHHLGIEEGSISHPIIMSEAPANPKSSRAAMTELLFEGYLVPKITYGVDGLFSLYKNRPNFAKNKSTVMVISFGFHTVHFLPVIKGQLDPQNMRRLNVGGFHLINFLHRGLQLKYSAHVNNITIGRAEEIIIDHCYVAKDFGPELRLWSDVDYYAKNVRKMQLPFTVAPKAPPVDPEVLKQRRQEMAKRLVEMNARKREEKLQEDEALLKVLNTCLDLLDQGYEEKVKRMLSKHDVTVKNVKELMAVVEKTKARIEKAKTSTPSRKKEATKDEPEAKKKREDMSEDEKREFDSWLDEVKIKRQELLDRRSARHFRKQQLTKRRTAASQERMRMISQLAKNTKKEDTFGMNDDDWDVYKKIRKDQGDSDSEEEQEKMNEYEAVLREHDPNFDHEGMDQDEISRDSPEWYQLHLATERIRVPEIFFQPSIVGCEQAGVSETLDFILKKYDDPKISADLAANVFVTGAAARLPGLMDRLVADLTANRPFRSTCGAQIAGDPTLDAFRGMQEFAKDFIDCSSEDSIWITKAEYEEKGPSQMKVHCCSNH